MKEKGGIKKMIQKKISLLVMALVLLVSGIFININANDGDDKDTVSLTVHKVWENLPEDFEVEGVEAVLLRNEEVIETITLDDSNSWTYTWNDLEAYDEAEELYEYRVEELNVGEGFEVSYQTSEEAKEIEVVITNTYLESEESEEPDAGIDDMEAIVDLEDIQAFSDEEDVPFSITINFEWITVPGIETGTMLQ